MPDDSAADTSTDVQSVPEGCRVILLSPFDVHFSQTRIRGEFQDGHTLEETTAEILPSAPSRGKGDGEEVEFGSEDKTKNLFLLTVPFPRIEVTRWRCKLREADGTPKVDPTTGLELYSQQEHWFTFDNRRLCCLQRAAAAMWPDEVRCEAIEVPAALARTRELRKFDTRTFGCSVLVGRRDDPNPECWSWRAAVGLPEEAQPEDGVARQRSMRWRGGRNGARGSNDAGGGRGGRRGAGAARACAEGGCGSGLEVARSALLFILVYLALRLGVSVFRQRLRATGSSVGPAPHPGPKPPS